MLLEKVLGKRSELFDDVGSSDVNIIWEGGVKDGGRYIKICTVVVSYVYGHE